jgi:hypothetical protein
MTTATRTPSAEHRKLDERRETAYAAVQEVKRRHKAHDAETEAMRARYTEHRRMHREQYEGADQRAKPKTHAAKLREAIRKRMEEPNPHQDELDAAVAEFHRHDIALTEWRERNIEARIAELEPDAQAAVEQIRAGLEQVLHGCAAYGANRERVYGIVISTRRLNGQDVREDTRVNEFAQFAAAVLDSEIVLPGLNDAAAQSVAEHGR